MKICGCASYNIKKNRQEVSVIIVIFALISCLFLILNEFVTNVNLCQTDFVRFFDNVRFAECSGFEIADCVIGEFFVNLRRRALKFENEYEN